MAPRNTRSWLLAAIAGAALLALPSLAGCTTTGKGKGTKPGWKVFKDERPLSASPGSVRSGPVELRIAEAVIEERGTLLGTPSYYAVVRGSVVSAEPLPLAELRSAFVVVGASGVERQGVVSAKGAGRATWQHQQHTGEPTVLPAGVVGELEVIAELGSGDDHDEPTALVFRGSSVALSR